MKDQKKIDNTLSDLQEELKHDTNNPELLNEIGVGYFLKGEYEKAEKNLKKAISLKADAKFHFNLGLVFSESGDLSKAIHSFMESLEIDPAHIPSLNNLAELYEINGDTEKAEELFNYIIRINPGNPLSHYNLGNFLLRQNNHIEAAKCYEESIKCDSNFTEAHYNIAWILYKAGALEESREYIQSGLQTNPKHTELQKLEQLVNRD